MCSALMTARTKACLIQGFTSHVARPMHLQRVEPGLQAHTLFHVALRAVLDAAAAVTSTIPC